jgi:hypothetical protein
VRAVNQIQEIEDDNDDDNPIIFHQFVKKEFIINEHL